MDTPSLFDYWKLCWTTKFADFSGRARRREFWAFVLFNKVIGILLSLPSILYVFATLEENPYMDWLSIFFGFSQRLIPVLIFSLFALIPSLAVMARRLQDSGRSAWWMALAFVPIVNYIGWLVLLVFMCLDSQRGENEWGPNPKEIAPELGEH